VAGCCEHADEPSGCIKCGGFLDCVKNVNGISLLVTFLPVQVAARSKV